MLNLARALVVGLAVIWSGASPAAVDEAKFASAKRASDEFARRIGVLKSGDALPRRSDPTIATLLGTAFDATVLGTGTVPPSDTPKIGELLSHANRIGLAYLMAGTGASDPATTDPKATARADENVVTYAPEIGAWMDFQIAVQNAVAATTLDILATAERGTLERPQVKAGLVNVRHGAATTVTGVLRTMALNGLDDEWRSARLAMLEAGAAQVGRIVTPEDGGRIRDTAETVAGRLKNPSIAARIRAYGDGVARSVH